MFTTVVWIDISQIMDINIIRTLFAQRAVCTLYKMSTTVNNPQHWLTLVTYITVVFGRNTMNTLYLG